jgi:CDP-diacylglycerol--serine O-phosphatidyltransferase
MAEQRPTMACSLLIAAAVFDVFDGLVARAQGGGSKLGAELDSLADLISFGAAPAVMVFYQAGGSLPKDETYPLTLLASVLLIVVASAWRLAKFNVDDRQTMGFLGLPTPANALFWVSLVAIANGLATPEGEMGIQAVVQDAIFNNHLIIIGLSILLAIMMLIELPLPGLKFKDLGWRGNEIRYVLLILGGSLLVTWQAMAVPIILFLYLASPIWGRVFAAQK